VRKRFFTPSGTNWSEQRETIYLYDGWNVVAELDGNNANATLRTYVWGTDLSGSRSGAGGVGGLLWVNNSQTTGGLPTGIQFVAYDGNGNVSGLTSATDGSNTSRYEYGPFGEPLRTTGPLAAAHPIRWSTKVTDDESGLVYYGFRYYSPGTGRWLSVDPIEELGALSLYAFLDNRAPNYVDVLGMKDYYEVEFPVGGSVRVYFTGHHLIPRELITKLRNCGLIDAYAEHLLAGGRIVDGKQFGLVPTPNGHGGTRHGSSSGYTAAVEGEIDKFLEEREKLLKSIGRDACCRRPLGRQEASALIDYIDKSSNPLIRVFNDNVGLGPKKLGEAVDEMRKRLGPDAGLPARRGLFSNSCLAKGFKCAAFVAKASLPFIAHASDAKVAEDVTERTGSINAGVGMYIFLKTPPGEASSWIKEFIDKCHEFDNGTYKQWINGANARIERQL
jgi:RHS repeat-associated protein